ncbi:hypothetical protein M758_3G013000 [Ceratodon purpureus]|nr:hypothetical protein M758_3G013000 [Ceratodon purpureus]
MASRGRRTLLLLVLLLACLVVVSNLGVVSGEARESEEEAVVEVVEAVEDGGDEDGDGEGEDYVGGGGGDGGDDGDDEDEEEEDEDEEDGESMGEKKAFDDSDVVVLGSSNFTAFVTGERYVMVEFYAPWCGHCQELAPEWAAAATALKGRVSVAKVDSTAHPDVSEALGVSSYPTLFLFVDGGPAPYPGDRTKDAIVNYVNKKMSLTVKALMSRTEAEPLLEIKSPIAIGYLNKLEGAEVDELTSVARREEGVEFYLTSDEDVAALFGLEKETKPALVLLKNVPDKRLVFKGTFKRDALYEFVSTNKMPLVIFYNKETTPLIFENTIKNQILCFVKDEEHWGYVQSVFEKVSRTFRKQALFIRVRLGDSEAQQASNFFGVTGENPITIMAFVTAEDGPKYLHEGELTFEGVKGFVEGFLANRLPPYYKSQAIPKQNNEDVKIAVSKNFEEMVLDESKDTLLELYAPDCHYCHDLEPIYKKLAKRLRSIPSLSIVKMDGLANEHPRAKPDGYPTLLFYPAGKKSFEPITFDGDRTVKGFYQFLKRKASIPFALPRTAKSKPSNKVAEDLKDEL